MKRIAVFFTMLAALLLAGPQLEAAPKAPKATGTFAIFIDNASYAACKAEVDAYRDQLVSEGLNAVVLADNWAKPEQVKARIAALAKKRPALEGMVFIGDIPVVRVRQGQHMTTAFKMNENTFPMIESSVTSDRYYDDPALDFEFIGLDSLGHFYYNLTEKGAQHVQPAWYSGRILVPADYPGDHEAVLRNYLKKVVDAHRKVQEEGDPLDHFLFFAGHGYNSDCLTVWRQQPMLFREYFPAAFKQSSGNHFYNFRQDPYMKYKLFNELQRPGTDVFMFSEHGAPEMQYINGSYPARGLQENIVELKRSLRSYYQRLLSRRGQEKADEFADEACAEYHFDRSIFSPEAIAAEAEGDSTAAADVNISLEDLEKIRTNAKFVILNACYNGSFHEPGYVAGYHIFGEGECIAAQGNTVNVLQDKWADQLVGLLALGERLGTWQKEFCWLESHLIGDPTFRFTPVAEDAEALDAVRRATSLKHRAEAGKMTSAEIRAVFESDPSWIVRRQALQAIAPFSDENTVQVILKGFDDPFESIRRESCHMAGRMGDPRFIAPLIKIETESDEVVRAQYAANSALSQFNPADMPAEYAATPRMQRTAKRIEEQMQTILDKTAATGDDGPSEREFAIRSLRNYPLHWRTDDLLKMVSDPTENEDLRIIMAEALGWFCYSIERDKIAGCLTDCLHHQHLSPRLRREMAKAVKRIQGK